jgi:hypothetical protein
MLGLAELDLYPAELDLKNLAKRSHPPLVDNPAPLS